MKAFGRERFLTLACRGRLPLLGAATLLGLLWQSPAYGGGPLLVGGRIGTPGEPFVWDTATAISYHTDQGPLGNQDNDQANTLVREGFDVWQNVTTATISFQRAGDLGQDVNGSNFMPFFNVHKNCSELSAFTNSIIYDTDGTITDGLLGEGNSQFVLGFAAPVCLDTVNTRFTRGEAVLNGLFIDGQAGPSNPQDPSVNKFKEVFVHEFGHLIGLDHSQINVDVLAPTHNRSDDNLFGLPLMSPFLLDEAARVDKFGAENALAPDDIAWISELYPSASFGATFGAITGQILFSDGLTPLQGANVVARQVDDPATPTIDESRRFAVSVVSGFRFTGNPGQSVTGTNPGSDFGSRDPTMIGAYRIPLTLGDYTVEVESIDPGFVGPSSVGPLGAGAGEQFPLPGPQEFFNATESDTDDPAAFDPVLVENPGTSVDSINIILNGTPSRFDAHESAP